MDNIQREQEEQDTRSGTQWADFLGDEPLEDENRELDLDFQPPYQPPGPAAPCIAAPISGPSIFTGTAQQDGQNIPVGQATYTNKDGRVIPRKPRGPNVNSAVDVLNDPLYREAAAMPPGDGQSLTDRQRFILQKLSIPERHKRATAVYSKNGGFSARCAYLAHMSDAFLRGCDHERERVTKIESQRGTRDISERAKTFYDQRYPHGDWPEHQHPPRGPDRIGRKGSKSQAQTEDPGNNEPQGLMGQPSEPRPMTGVGSFSGSQSFGGQMNSGQSSNMDLGTFQQYPPTERTLGGMGANPPSGPVGSSLYSPEAILGFQRFQDKEMRLGGGSWTNRTGEHPSRAAADDQDLGDGDRPPPSKKSKTKDTRDGYLGGSTLSTGLAQPNPPLPTTNPGLPISRAPSMQRQLAVQYIDGNWPVRLIIPTFENSASNQQNHNPVRSGHGQSGGQTATPSEPSAAPNSPLLFSAIWYPSTDHSQAASFLNHKSAFTDPESYPRHNMVDPRAVTWRIFREALKIKFDLIMGGRNQVGDIIALGERFAVDHIWLRYNKADGSGRDTLWVTEQSWEQVKSILGWRTENPPVFGFRVRALVFEELDFDEFENL